MTASRKVSTRFLCLTSSDRVKMRFNFLSQSCSSKIYFGHLIEQDIDLIWEVMSFAVAKVFHKPPVHRRTSLSAADVSQWYKNTYNIVKLLQGLACHYEDEARVVLTKQHGKHGQSVHHVTEQMFSFAESQCLEECHLCIGMYEEVLFFFYSIRGFRPVQYLSLSVMNWMMTRVSSEDNLTSTVYCSTFFDESLAVVSKYQKLEPHHWNGVCFLIKGFYEVKKVSLTCRWICA